jgi:hypothetical protein
LELGLDFQKTCSTFSIVNRLVIWKWFKEFNYNTLSV